jgi:hypothetical protein
MRVAELENSLAIFFKGGSFAEVKPGWADLCESRAAEENIF